MSDRHSLIAFCGTLAAIVVLYGLGAVLAFMGKPTEALGISGAGTGLIGVLGTFKPKTGGQTVEQADNVNQTQGGADA